MSHQSTVDQLSCIYQRIRPYIQVTPLLEVESLSQLTGGRVLLKAESLQKTGAFKFRGALYRLMMLSESEKKQGVIAYSSGNFAKGLASAGRLLDITVHLVMPHDAPKNKIASARAQGARITLCDSHTPSREEAASNLAAQIAHKSGKLLLHPFDDTILIQGQASVAIELKQQLIDSGWSCQQILCPVGGGSLVAGTSMVFPPSVQIRAIEAQGYAGMKQSLEQKTLSRAEGGSPCDCDALQALQPGQSNWETVRKKRVIGSEVHPSAVKQAMQLAYQELKLVLEPSGAIALGSVIQNPELYQHQAIVAIATGGNVDTETFTSFCLQPNSPN